MQEAGFEGVTIYPIPIGPWAAKDESLEYIIGIWVYDFVQGSIEPYGKSWGGVLIDKARAK
jgi:hypothetical protein